MHLRPHRALGWEILQRLPHEVGERGRAVHVQLAHVFDELEALALGEKLEQERLSETLRGPFVLSRVDLSAVRIEDGDPGLEVRVPAAKARYRLTPSDHFTN